MITRKVFLRQLTGGGLALVLAGCGGGDDGGSAGTPAAAPGSAPDDSGCSAFTFTANHGHELWIPVADLDSTTDKTYSVQGTATHDHPVTLTVAQLALLKAGQAISLTTPMNFEHTHDVSGGCA